MAKFSVSEAEREGAQVLMPADSESSLGDQAQQWDEFDAFREQGESAQAGLNVWVYRVPSDTANNPISGARMSLMFTAPIDRYTIPQILERVKKEYMDRGRAKATIRIHVRKERGAGTLWNKLFLIEKSVADDEPEASSSNSDIGAIAAVFQKSLDAAAQQNREMLAQLFQRMNAAPAVDPMLQTERMVTMVTGLAGVLAKPSAAVSPAASIAEQIAGVREILKLSQSLGSDGGVAGGEETEGTVGVLKAIAPIADLVKELIVNARTVPAVPVRRRLAAPVSSPLSGPAPGTVPAQAAQPVAEPPRVTESVAPHGAIENPQSSAAPHGVKDEDAMFAKISEVLDGLVAKAEQGADPAALGELVADFIPEPYEQRFLNVLDSPHWFEKLAVLNSKVTLHRPFFDTLRAAILAQYAEDETPPEPHGSVPTI